MIRRLSWASKRASEDRTQPDMLHMIITLQRENEKPDFERAE